MSEQIHWRPAWALGIDVLDEDHREMVRLINRLMDPTETAALSARLGDLIAHLRRHCDVEEVFLQAIDYPWAINHAREHQVQLAELVVLGRNLAGSSAPVLDAGELRGIKDWFFNHVVAEDRRFAAYYRTLVGNPERRP